MAQPLAGLGRHADLSWMRQLSADPEAEGNAPNKRSRQVRSGHYVPVRPTPLPKASLVIHSPPMAEALGISEEEAASEAFVAFFSGDQGRVPELESWCTPYALAIMGQQLYHNCPFGNGNGYGDGRAISVGEVVVAGRRWEMQLKGGGTTPFCRGADGRAVLRSSVREFLASEAMYHLGVDTTRALSLVVSAGETVRRPWYSGRNDDEDGGVSDPDTVVTEPCAITTRVAPSFLRIGHIDLFGRRAAAAKAAGREQKELELIVEHALFREYPEANVEGQSLPDRAAAMLEAAAGRLAELVAGWLRVGFCQGNFNSDNCLISGRTMDYGPFGWMDQYDPSFAKWLGSGAHFAFMNQPSAAVANYSTLVTAVLPVLGSDGMQRAKAIFAAGSAKIKAAAADVWRVKLGFASADADGPAAAGLWKDLEPMMQRSAVDYTVFWRQLAEVAGANATEAADAELAAPLAEAFYKPPAGALLAQWAAWLRRWLAALAASAGSGGPEATAQRLKAANPKYVPREWMLVEAYKRAAHGDYGLVHELYSLFLRPYDEQPDFADKYYRRAPAEALTRGGCAYMS